MMRIALLAAALAGSVAQAGTQTFESAFDEAVARYCTAVEWLERDLEADRPSPSRMQGSIREVIETGRNVIGFMGNFTLSGTGADQAARLIGSVQSALACRQRAAEAGPSWWESYRDSGFSDPSDKRREEEFAAQLPALKAAAEARLSERP